VNRFPRRGGRAGMAKARRARDLHLRRGGFERFDAILARVLLRLQAEHGQGKPAVLRAIGKKVAKGA
jgi:hypothetical protein